MFPHERSLVKEYANRPFTIIGVNSDKDPVVLKQKNAEENITWRSFQNQPAGADVAISTTWNLQGWPTLYLIDHEGVIRHKWLGNPGDETVEAAIKEMVEAAEAAGTK